jgi:Icc-related predicted phosphoesterase
MNCFFVSDLHGRLERYRKLFLAVRNEHPTAVFFGGDILPSALKTFLNPDSPPQDFFEGFFIKELFQLKKDLKRHFPKIFLILGNDDSRMEEKKILDAEKSGLLEYVHNKKVPFDSYRVFGYAYVPPSPFLLKDWEKYDVSRYVDPGSVSPEEGFRSMAVLEDEVRYSTIAKDLAALDGKMIDHVPLDLHVGSIAIKRFIEKRQPMLSLHGHIHEAPRLTQTWKDRIGKTRVFSAAHDGPELALVRFNLENQEMATRELL